MPPFRLAESRAEVFALMEPAVAVKEPLVWAVPILTPGGTVMLALLLDRVTFNAEGAGADKVTVQLEVPGAFTVAGEQLRLLGTIWVTGSAIDPAVPDPGMEFPPAVEATTPVICTGIGFAAGLAAI